MVLRLLKFCNLLFVMSLVVANVVSATEAASTGKNTNPIAYASDVAVEKFVEQMYTKHNFDKQQLLNYFSKISRSQEVIDKISHPAERLPWDKYKKIFLGKTRVSKGVAFWQTHKKILEQASAKCGVPVEIIVAICGVETFYGKMTGGYPVFQSLSTLAFSYPPRSNFFTKELEHYLLLTRDENLDPLKITGSYAGAMGAPQFMPSSYRNYGVDFAKVGRVDLVHNITNSIGSIANYLHKHGWNNSENLVTKKVNIAVNNSKSYEKFISNSPSSPKPKHRLLDLPSYKTLGLSNNGGISDETKVALLKLGSEYWVSSNNFYVITRYNRSVNYAMAVYQLSEAIKVHYNYVKNNTANNAKKNENDVTKIEKT